MHDARLEDRLRRVLSEEADGLPLTVTVDRLERRLAERRRHRAVDRIVALAAAAAVVVAVGAGSSLLLSSRHPATLVDISPTPSATVAPTIVPTTSLVPTPTAGLPAIPPSGGDLVVLWESLGEGTGERGTPVTDSAGVIPVADRYVVTVACRGPGMIRVALGGTFDEPLGGALPEPCGDGTPSSVEFSGGVPAGTVLLVPLVEADASAAWRILIEGAGVRAIWPTMTARGPDGTTVGSTTDCLTYELADGSSGGDSCGPPPLPPVDETLVIRPGDEVAFALGDGWRLVSPTIRAVPAVQAESDDEPVTVYDIADVDGTSEEVAVSIAQTGDLVVTVSGTYERDGNRFHVGYRFRIRVGP